MKNFVVAIVLTLSSMCTTAAPASDESIKTLFAVMKAEILLESIYSNLEPAMRQAMNQAVAGKTLTADQKRIMDRAPQRMGELLRKELSWSKMEPIQIAIYRESFEQSEIDGLISFYKSPAGQAFVNKMPLVTQKAMIAMQTQMQEMMPRIKVAMDGILSEAKLAPAR